MMFHQVFARLPQMGNCSVLSIDSGLSLLQLLMSTGAGGSHVKRRMFDSPFWPDQVL